MRKAPKRPTSANASAPVIPFLAADALETPERVITYCFKNKLINGVEINIEKLIDLNDDLKLIKEDLGEGIDAFIREISPGKYEIAVNSKHSFTRQRFSMAYEFAHYQLHRENLAEFAEGERILHRSRNIIERQANVFAANMLMPEALFREEVRRTRGDITLIAKRFNVSPLVLRYRAKSLGMRGHGV
jgi:Zn-dependent peptidase ImmA (M78 family)